jgi:hypothetical protein
MVAWPIRAPRSCNAVLAILIFAAVVALLGACDKMPLVAPSGTVMTLTADANVLPVNGSAEITAVLIEAGQAQPPSSGTGNPPTTSTATGAGTTVHNGTLVSFTTTLGRVDPAEARTTNGKAVVRLLANGQSGVATVTAFSGAASKTLTINVGAAAASRVVVTASPQALPAIGGTTTITATVQDQQGNGILGVPVSFSTTAGSLAATSAVTDNSGNAVTTLTTNAAATVTATAGGGTGGGTGGTAAPTPATVAITILPNATVTITPPTGAVVVSTPTSFTVNVGTTVIVLDVVVEFGDGEKLSLGPISASQPVPHMYGIAGALTATATASFADGTVKKVSTPVVVADYQVSAGCSANVAFGGTSTFTATVSPTGMSLNDFIWDFGSEGTQHGNPTTHTFQSKGTKVVKLTVVPTKGSSKSSSCQLEVN